MNIESIKKSAKRQLSDEFALDVILVVRVTAVVLIVLLFVANIPLFIDLLNLEPSLVVIEQNRYLAISKWLFVAVLTTALICVMLMAAKKLTSDKSVILGSIVLSLYLVRINNESTVLYDVNWAQSDDVVSKIQSLMGCKYASLDDHRKGFLAKLIALNMIRADCVIDNKGLSLISKANSAKEIDVIINNIDNNKTLNIPEHKTRRMVDESIKRRSDMRINPLIKIK